MTRAAFAKGVERQEALSLAVGLWLTVTVAHLAFTVAIGGNPILLLFPFVWCAHGLILTWPLQIVIARAQAFPFLAKWAAMAVAVLVLTLLQAWLDTQSSLLLVRFLFDVLNMESFTAALRFDYGHGQREVGLQISMMIYFWVFGCYAVASNLLEAQARAARSDAMASDARIMALHLQLNPHLLFNALNAVSGLILAGENARADEANLALSAFLRRALEIDPVEPVAVAEELEMLEGYLEIERLRFGEALQVRFDIADDTLACLTPPFILQPLVENAVKHGAAPGRVTQLTVSSRREEGRLVLTVGNPLSGYSRPGTRTGLKNVRDRLAVLYDGRAQLITEATETDYRAAVVLPL